MQQIYQWVNQNELQKLAKMEDDLSFLVDEVKLAEVFKSIEITMKDINQQRETFQTNMNGLFGIFDQPL
jgi:ATP-dependent helicase/DNAse subunit B